jgi:flagellar hook-associated protein 2
VTLDELSDLINSTTDIPVTASVISSGATSYQLVLTGNDTGATNAYTLTNALTGGTSAVTFADFDSDGTSGDDASDNAVSATDAAATVNNISVTSSTNKITGAVPGATITLLTKDAATTVTLTVTRDDSEVKGLVDGFVDVYNELSDYLDQQFALAADGSATAIGRDGLLRGLRTALRQTITESYSVGGTYSYLAEVGIGSNAAGELTFDKTMFDDALETSLADVESLFLGAGGTDGAFVTLEALVQTYTETNGLLPAVQERLDDQVLAIDDRVQILEERLAARRASLEREFIAADLAIAQLNNQLASLNNLGKEFRLF